MTEKIDPGSK